MGEDINMEHGDLRALLLDVGIRQDRPIIALSLMVKAIFQLLLLRQSWSVSINEAHGGIEIKYSNQSGETIIARYTFRGYEYAAIQQAILNFFKITEQSLKNGKSQGIARSHRKTYIFVISLGSKTGHGISIFPKACQFDVGL